MHQFANQGEEEKLSFLFKVEMIFVVSSASLELTHVWRLVTELKHMLNVMYGEEFSYGWGALVLLLQRWTGIGFLQVVLGRGVP